MRKIDWLTVGFYLFILAMMVLSVVATALIAESDMPDWLKYLLLK